LTNHDGLVHVWCYGGIRVAEGADERSRVKGVGRITDAARTAVLHAASRDVARARLTCGAIDALKRVN
jgi:hypothetical protein